MQVLRAVQSMQHCPDSQWAPSCLQLEANGDANFALGVDVYFTCALSESDLLTQVRQQGWHFPAPDVCEAA